MDAVLLAFRAMNRRKGTLFILLILLLLFRDFLERIVGKKSNYRTLPFDVSMGGWMNGGMDG